MDAFSPAKALGLVDSVDLASVRLAALIAPVIERVTFGVIRAALPRLGDVPARYGAAPDALQMFGVLRTALASRGVTRTGLAAVFRYHPAERLRQDLDALTAPCRFGAANGCADRASTALYLRPRAHTSHECLGDAAPVRSDNELVRIRAARVAELPVLQAIERAAGRVFCDIGMPGIAEYDPWPLQILAACQEAGQLWVVADEADDPVAYLMAGMVDGCMHVEQVSVHPDSARRGLGRALLEHVVSRAAADSIPALTLTTFAQVPWNAPYYARCGFRVLDDVELTPGLRAIRQREAALGLDRWPRVCMRRDIGGYRGAR